MAIQVAIYAIKVKKKGERDSDQKLSDLGKAGDFLNFAVMTMKAGEADSIHKKNEAMESAARFAEIQATGRTVQGRLHMGHYGVVRPVIDVNSSKQVFRKERNHADIQPMFFRLDVPIDRDEAILIIQKSRQMRVKSTFLALLKMPFEKSNPDLQLVVDRFMPAEVFRNYLSLGSIQKVRFTKMSIPADFADSYDTGHKEVKGTAELIIKAKRNGDLPMRKKLLGFIDSKKPMNEFYSLPNFDFDNVKVVVKIGKRTRNVDVGNKRTSPMYELEKVENGPDGLPTYASLSAAVDDLSADVLSSIYKAGKSDE